MIAPARITEVRRLLAEGRHSQRAIARMTGISRGTVMAVANGRRPDYAERPRDDDSPLPRGPRRRCGQCGALVYTPCRACALRRQLAQDTKHRHPARHAAEAAPGLDLRGEHRRRYEEVRARRQRAGEFSEDNGTHER